MLTSKAPVRPSIRERLSPLAWLALAFVVLNAPFWWMQQDYFLVRPSLNIELFLPLVLYPRFPRAAVAALVVCWILDLIVSHSATFHFASAFEFLRSAQFLSETHLPGFLSLSRVLMVLPFLIAAAVAWACVRNLRKGSLPWAAGLFYALLIAAVDVSNGSSIVSKRAIHLLPGNPAGSPTFTLMIRAWQSRSNTALTPLPRGTSAAEVADIAGWARSHPQGSAVLVLVESMGWHNDERMRNWLFTRAATPDVLKTFSAVQHEIRFTEATTSAELRELCGQRGSYRSMSPAAGASCLPARLAAAGWQTNGYHGFSGNMFDRQQWWSATGLQKSFFAESMFAEGGHRCGGGFPGLCDADVVEFALAHDTSPATFTYILTLNSHLPLTPLPIPADLANICRQVGTTEQVCLITATIGRALDALGASLARRRGNLPLVVVVGDHSPPFSDLTSRNDYAADVVPAFVLTPTAASAPR